MIYIGVMSGTSLDAIDVALCSIDRYSCTLLASLSYPFNNNLRDEILSIINGRTTLQQIGQIDTKLGIEYSKAINLLLKEQNLNSKDVKAIGLHGQTVWHEPRGEFPFSMQLGNPSLVAVRCGITVVSDFRQKDIALGGEGAPFAPAFHRELFSHINKCSVVNIGGMANITLFSPKLIGYDCGCGNILMDLWIEQVKGESYDYNGEWAKSGKINVPLLESMLSDDYFKLKYPKSTGREYFNKDFLIKYLEPFDKISDRDIQATLLELTARVIADEIKKFDIETLLICGGGAKNIYLLERIEKNLPYLKVDITDNYGVSSDNMEAMIFAWFAYKRLKNEAIDLMTVTGAKNNTILGGIYASN